MQHVYGSWSGSSTDGIDTAHGLLLGKVENKVKHLIMKSHYTASHSKLIHVLSGHEHLITQPLQFFENFTALKM